MNVKKLVGAIGISLIIFSFQVAPSFGAVAIIDPDNPPTYDVSPEDPDAEFLVDTACQCSDDWKNHGEYVKCVAQNVKGLYQEGLVTKEEGSAIISKKAKGDCGKEDNQQKKHKK